MAVLGTSNAFKKYLKNPFLVPSHTSHLPPPAPQPLLVSEKGGKAVEGSWLIGVHHLASISDMMQA
jgi:hypothetical protein